MFKNFTNYKYRIVAVDDSYLNTGEVFVKVQVAGSNKTFNRSVKELYTKNWLEDFCKEDVAHIAALYTAEHTSNLELVKQFPKKSHSARHNIALIGILFMALLTAATLAAFKIIKVGHFSAPAGLLFYPLTYVLSDILTEVYGFKVSRRIIWSAWAANLLIVLGLLGTVYLQPSIYWHHQAEYQTVFSLTPRLFIASIIGFLIGEFINATILAKLKILTSGRYLWLRLITSTAFGAFIDITIFNYIAYTGIFPADMIWQLFTTTYFMHLLYQLCLTPLTAKIAQYLKRKDNIDHYDFTTKFNPFSLSVD